MCDDSLVGDPALVNSPVGDHGRVVLPRGASRWGPPAGYPRSTADTKSEGSFLECQKTWRNLLSGETFQTSSKSLSSPHLFLSIDHGEYKNYYKTQVVEEQLRQLTFQFIQLVK